MITLSGTAASNLISGNSIISNSINLIRNTGTGLKNKVIGNTHQGAPLIIDTNGIDANIRYVPFAYTEPLLIVDNISSSTGTILDIQSLTSGETPTNAVSIKVRARIRDSGTDNTNSTSIMLYKNGETDTEAKEAGRIYCRGADLFTAGHIEVALDADGKFQYDVSASGAGTLDAYIVMIGYYETF